MLWNLNYYQTEKTEKKLKTLNECKESHNQPDQVYQEIALKLKGNSALDSSSHKLQILQILEIVA